MPLLVGRLLIISLGMLLLIDYLLVILEGGKIKEEAAIESSTGSSQRYR